MPTMRGRKARDIAKWHPRFNAADSDIIVESSDLTLFKLHRKNLRTYAGAFPLPADAKATTANGSTPVVKINLPEPASVLEILLEYLYPKMKQPHRDIEDLDVKELMTISDAVGKYQVFAAQHLCVIRLRAIAKDHPLEIFHLAVKYGLPSVIDDTAPHIVLSPVLGILKRLPANAAIPWLEYNEATWRAVFSVSRGIIQSIKMTSLSRHNGVCKPNNVKSECLNGAEVWVGYLENLSTLADLEAKLQDLRITKGLFCDPSCGLKCRIEESCQGGLQKAKLIKFTNFLFKEEE